MSIVRRMFPQAIVEKASIDEAYLGTPLARLTSFRLHALTRCT